jgi:hypothetical protein
MTQSSPDDEPEAIDVQLMGSPSISSDQRYIAGIILAPEYLALPEDEQTAFETLPSNIVVLDLQTGDTIVAAAQSENFPDEPWIYRSPPTWSPTGHQIAIINFNFDDGVSISIFDVDNQTLTEIEGRVPMGYSDAGMFDVPSVNWSAIGIYSWSSHVASDYLGFEQTVTLIDPTGDIAPQTWVVGRTLSGGEFSRDTMLDIVGGFDETGEPALLMVDGAGDWFIRPPESYGRSAISTPALRPAGGGDIEIRFARTSELDPEARHSFPHYRAFIRRGDDPLMPLDGRSSWVSANTFHAAPDGSSVILWQNGEMVQWFGSDDIRDIDLDGRRILDWGDWVFQAEARCWHESIVAVRDDSVQTIRMIHDEPIPLYAAPGDTAEIIGEVQPDELVRLVTGPLCFDRTTWFEVVVGEDDVYGWVQGHGRGGVWLEDFH